MISYSSVQRTLAQQLHERLAQGGCRPKLDHLDISTGDRWRETIAWWLSACQVAVVILSKQAIESPWVRYELSVLSNREQVGNVRLVLVYVGVTPDYLRTQADFEPLQLTEVQSYHQLPDDEPDEDALDALVRSITDVDDADAAPIERLVTRVADEVRAVAPTRVESARADLAEPGAEVDPWLVDASDVRRSFAEAYCAAPITRTYRSLQTLAQDRHLKAGDLNVLIDLNVMTIFDSWQLDQLHRAAQGRSRRSVVSSVTRADLAEVATQAVHEVHDSLYAYRFVVNGPIMGLTSAEVAEGLADELRHAIAAVADDDEDPDDFLADVAQRKHPVFCLLASAVGIKSDVMRSLERWFPSVVFVVLSSATQTMLELAEKLGLDGVGAGLRDETAWARHVRTEREVATERAKQRKDLHRLKRAVQR
ncbi:MAG TPA: toll/interleukin-1 receptor domain-containing protein [Acidimicrobiales bacterium]|nr:toll/interleukin-1 receptor domain-containing protein [Acidimicrobiales bacterium]